MKNIYILFPFFILLSLLNFTAEKKYSYSDFDQKELYTPMNITTKKYNSSNPCVTFDDLVAYHYTDNLQNANNSANVTPENFCYSLLTYNITREDFFDIINKTSRNKILLFISFFVFSLYSPTSSPSTKGPSCKN